MITFLIAGAAVVDSFVGGIAVGRKWAAKKQPTLEQVPVEKIIENASSALKQEVAKVTSAVLPEVQDVLKQAVKTVGPSMIELAQKRIEEAAKSAPKTAH